MGVREDRRARRTPRAPRSRERYTLDSLASVFKGGAWVDDRPISEIDPEEKVTSSAYITVVGGTKYEKTTISRYIAQAEATVVVGAGRGVESDIAKDPGSDVIVLQPDVERYGKNARKVNVEQVLSFAPDSPLLLVGTGERVKQAHQWLNRARWPREVIELP